MKHSRAIIGQASSQFSFGADRVTGNLLRDVRALIDAARDRVAQVVNAGLVRLYWSVGHRIRQDILKETRAACGEHILPTPSAKLVPAYGDGFSAIKNHEEVELLQLDKSGIRVAEYMTELPPRKILEKKLHTAILLARDQLAQKGAISTEKVSRQREHKWKFQKHPTKQ